MLTLLKASMNNKQRKEWEAWVEEAIKSLASKENNSLDEVIVAVNAYILKLERELQNIKGGRKIAAILKSKVPV